MAQVTPEVMPEQPAIDVQILADPRSGAADAEGSMEVDQIATPAAEQADQQTEAPVDPTATGPAPIAQIPPPELAESAQAAAPANPEPSPPLIPEPTRVVPTRPAATPPLPMLPPARMRAGSSSAGQSNGTTDIIHGNNIVPAGPDPSQYNIPPRYPREAAQRGQQGLVRLNVLVATDGSALYVDVAGSSGYPLLDRAARDAVAKWRFRAARDGGLAVPSTIPVTLSFVLDERR